MFFNLANLTNVNLHVHIFTVISKSVSQHVIIIEYVPALPVINSLVLFGARFTVDVVAMGAEEAEGAEGTAPRHSA